MENKYSRSSCISGSGRKVEAVLVEVATEAVATAAAAAAAVVDVTLQPLSQNNQL